VRMHVTNRNAAGTTYAAADFGLFTHVEKMGKEYLANRGLPTYGNLYKAEDFQFRSDPRLAIDGTGKPVSKSEFEKVLALEADNDNHRKLITMLAELNDPGTHFDTFFARYFDKANYLTWLASNILMGNRDTVNQNFALYQPNGSDKFYFLPWDYDASFNFEDQPNEKADGPIYSSLQLTAANWWEIPLHQRFLQDPTHLEELKKAIDDIAGAYLTQAKITARINGYLALVQPFISTPPDSTFLPAISATPVTEWANEGARIATVIQTNRDRFFAALETPMPFWQDVALDGASIGFDWDASVDLQGDPVTYTVTVSSTPNFLTIQQQLNATAQTAWTIPKLPNGVWYMKVTSRDSKGNVQIAFDVFTDGSDNNHFGVLAFQVTDTSVVTLN